MRIRSIEPGDRVEWLRLLTGLHPHHPESEHVPSVDAFFASSRHDELLPAAVFACERPDGRLAGFLELSVRNYAEGCSGPTPYIESWYVDPDVRGKGIGRLLIVAAEEWARERGYGELASDTEIENVSSQRAHQALVFQEVERAAHFRKQISARERATVSPPDYMPATGRGTFVLCSLCHMPGPADNAVAVHSRGNLCPGCVRAIESAVAARREREQTPPVS
jgi:aminoglycoside 6'-N-acetyltransferase I